MGNWFKERFSRLATGLSGAISTLLVLAAWVFGGLAIFWLAMQALGFFQGPIDRVAALVRGGEAPSSVETLGRIYVESPEVYTRQRLVNDRFAQDAWLRGQLGALDKPGNSFVERQTQQSSRLDFRAGGPLMAETEGSAGEGEEATVPAAGPVADAPDSAPAAEASSDAPFQVEFELKSAVRDKIRQLILENSLDDRHDLSGNTVYGLKFDTAVVPGSNTLLRPTVIIKMDVDPFDCDEADGACDAEITKAITRGAAGRRSPEYQDEIDLLSRHFESWHRNIEFRLNDFLANSRSETLAENWFEGLAARIDAAMTLGSPSETRVGSGLKRCIEANFDIELDDIPEQIDTAVHHVFGLPEYSVEIRAQLVEKDSLRNLVCQMVGFDAGEAMDAPRFDVVTVALPAPWDAFFDLSVTTAPWGFTMKPKRRGLLLTRETITGENGAEIWPTGFGARKRCAVEPAGAASAAPTLICQPANDAAQGGFVYLYDQNYDVSTRTLSDRLEFSDLEISALYDSADFRPNCVNDAGAVIPAAPPAPGCRKGTTFDGSSVDFQLGLYEFIRRVLDIDVYSYAAFPRGDVSGVVSEVGNSVNLGLGAAGPASGFGAQLSGSARSVETDAEPTILNFAAGEDSGAFFDFGWTIVESGRIRPTLASQMVLVSVPAYLETLTLEVWRGWLDSDAGPKEGEVWTDYPDLEARIALMLRDAEQTRITVHLPPDYQALDSLVAPAASRLGPLINVDSMNGCELDGNGGRRESVACLRIVSGEAPSVVIPGARLWRSTIVTLGGHQASQITVMPDMRGIIATFDPIGLVLADAGYGEDVNAPKPLDLVVWTSEGTDTMRNFAEVIPSQDWSEASGEIEGPAPRPGPPANP